jgi:hypothetical protein
MPRYHFHVTRGHEVPDQEGTDLASLPMARCHAVKLMADVLCGSPEAYWEHENFQVVVTDETWMTLFTVEMNSTDSPFLRGSQASDSAVHRSAT